jgi:spoIIIJ-associated protein
MPPNERRIIHLALAEDRRVSTASVGEGDDRKVSINPKR